MLIPKDENFEEIQKTSIKKRITSPERTEPRKLNVKVPQLKSPIQKINHKEEKEENVVNNFSKMLSQLDNDQALHLLESLKKELRDKKKA